MGAPSCHPVPSKTSTGATSLPPPTAAAVTSCLAPPGGDGIRRQEPDNGPLAVEGGDAAGVEVAGVDVERGAGHFPPPPGQGLRVQAASPSSRTAAPKAAVTRHV